MKLFSTLLLVTTLLSPAISVGDLSRLVLRSPSPAAGSYYTAVARGSTIVAATSKGEIVKSSDDGATWVPSALLTYEQNGSDRTINFNASAASASEWIFVSQDDRWARSTNLINWTTGRGGGASSGLVFAEGLYVSSSFSGGIETSPNGETWTDAAVPAGVTRLDGLAYGGGTFVAAGRQNLITSPDGLTWSEIAVPVTSPEWFEDVTWLDGTFYAMGREGLFLTSPDGQNWTKRDLGTDNAFNGGVIAEPAGEISIYSNNRLYTLNDSLTAVTESDLSPGFTRVVQTDAGSLIGVGNFARLYRRGPDETEWENLNESLSPNFDSVAFGNDTFVIVDQSGRIFSSIDGTDWTLRVELTDSSFRSKVIFDGSQFFHHG